MDGGEDSLYGGIVIIVLCKGTRLSLGSRPLVLAVSMDPSALILKQDQARKDPVCAS